MEQKNDDIIAISKNTLHESDFCEWLTATTMKRTKAIYNVVIASISLIILISLIASLLGAHIISVQLILVLIFCVLITALCRFGFPNWLGKKRYQQYLIMNKDISDRKIVFYSNRLEFVVNNAITNKFFYSDIQRTILTKNLFIIQFSNQVSCILRHDGFIAGNLDVIQKQIADSEQKKSKDFHNNNL